MIPDVLIAGAGPVGLFLAAELRLAGVSVRVLEQAADPCSPLKQLPFGLRGLSVPTLEALDRRGLLAQLHPVQPAADRPGSQAATAHWKNPRRPAAGHFAGIQFFQDKVDTSRWQYRLPDAPSASLPIDLQTLEQVLARHALALGADIHRGVAVTAVEQTPDGVLVHAGGEIHRGRWLVGCDGARSVVRKSSGVDFSGTDPEFTGYSADVTLAEPHTLQPGRHYTPTGMYTYAAPGTIAMVDFDGGAFHRSQPITLEQLQTVLRRVSGTDVTIRAVQLATTWTDRAFQASAYRNGRVLLAGDAAHIHSPMGGQGLNLGIGDAINLGWKLAATIRGDAAEGLLDSYGRERHPIGAQVLDWSRAQVALMRPTRSTRALEAILRDLIDTPDGATYFAERVLGVTLRMDLGDAHPLVGRSMANAVLADGQRVNERLRSGKGLLVDFHTRDALQAVAQRWPERLDHAVGIPTGDLGLSAVLVRPDGVVCWASDAPGNARDAEAALMRLWLAVDYDRPLY